MKKAKEQKELLTKLLNEKFGKERIHCKENDKEIDFEWSNITNNILNNPDYEEILQGLETYRDYSRNDFAKKNKLRYDYYIEGEKVVIEYDESQHFTEPRSISLSKYPNDIVLNFDKQEWIKKCKELNRKDNDPVYPSKLPDKFFLSITRNTEKTSRLHPCQRRRAMPYYKAL